MTNKTVVEIAILKTKMDRIVKDVNEIKTNHLPHIDSRLGKIERRIAYYIGGLAVLTLVIRFFPF